MFFEPSRVVDRASFREEEEEDDDFEKARRL